MYRLPKSQNEHKAGVINLGNTRTLKNTESPNNQMVIWSIITFLFLSAGVFWGTYKSYLRNSRSADEGVWIASNVHVTEHGPFPLYVKGLRSKNVSLAESRFCSFVLSTIIVCLLGRYLCFSCRGVKSILLIFLCLFLIWAHPQLLKSFVRANSECYSILFLTIALVSGFEIVRRCHLTHLIIFCISLAFLSCSSPYGAVHGFALTFSALIVGQFKNLGQRLGLLFFAILACNVVWLWQEGRESHFNIYGNYFSQRIATSSDYFASPIVTRLLPVIFSSKVMYALIGLAIFLLLLSTSVGRKSEPFARFHACTILFFFILQFILEYIVGEPSIHEHLISPITFLILTFLITFTRNRAYIQQFIAFGALAFLTIPTLFNGQFNRSEYSLSEAASLANSAYAEGRHVIFSGSILYFTLYPWLDSEVREHALVCLSGAGFNNDKYFGAPAIASSKQITGDFLLFGNSESAVVILSKHGQGIRVDIPSTWKLSTKYFFYSDSAIRAIIVRTASKVNLF